MTTRFLRWLPACLLALALAVPPAAARAAEAEATPLTVVELFTSQGCSSCPPADRFLGELAKRPDVLALSEHVDYWDYIGWKDVFASAEISQRQRDYAKKFGMRYVYTPQMVVQGMTHATGSDREAVENLIEDFADLPRHPIEVEMAGGEATIVVPAGNKAETATVWLLPFDGQRAVDVRRGENAGRTLIYHHVVRELREVGTWRGDVLRIPVDVADMAAEGYAGCAVLLQSTDSGRILGAVRVSL